ncbi:hypothetical protein SELMODRAFT_118155 [Selaginella moellendorffii]|uniref:Uncharacterized protein GPAT5-1 n=1 Tax=Selaginella moellendorffii TaxID=88036 RepID=D8SIQ6_SELML|nr:glycerol-3-phosphate 2-O-acyltransferase 6 [Selaginella moellendorffii]EFJ15664.1 hypothetical protein SELMODRAFT_118155 [Selaginella moellendorffii]|eukprot:XP_002983322.1 glycerol-3-phosphate 2-O-acyltransferase 6 [Selaginella moellendorffii]
MAEFPPIEKCSSTISRESESVASDLDGTLLRGRSSFPYFFLTTFETSGILRSWLLLLVSPLVWLLYHFISEAAGIKLLIFASLAGVPVSQIECIARSVLPRFYLQDLNPETWKVFSSFGKKIVVTANPRILVESLCKEFLGADEVIGTELEMDSRGRATGFVKSPGVLVGENKAKALLQACDPEQLPDVGLGDRQTDFPFMKLCKEGYVVPPSNNVEPVPKSQLLKPIIFHDGRLVQLPTPLVALVTLLWIPVGFVLACLRIAAGSLLPMSIVYHAFWLLGVRVTVKGTPPPRATKNSRGVLFICSHRTLLDPIFLSCALGRGVSAVTYSVSRLSEILSPIKTVALSRNRDKDAAQIRELLKEGDLVICPEGTTCREPFLLRFSALFAELADDIVPVAMDNRMSMFHGTAARAWKGMDPFYFFMNPSPSYEVTFLQQLPEELTCKGGKSSHEVANHIQRALAGVLDFECTNLTRKDKYKALVGTDGSVESKKST